MQKLLTKLGFNSKQATIYLALLEFGSQPASIIAKKAQMPKSSVLFLCEQLIEMGVLQKSQKGKTQYFYADPKELEKVKLQQLHEQSEVLKRTIPLLQEFKSPFSSEPKLNFFEGIAGCKKAYLQILESKSEVLEFGVHSDLEAKFGQKFMDDFIVARIKKDLQLKGIVNEDDAHKNLSKFNLSQLRETKFVDDKIGTLYSSICIFDDKVLLLNLHNDAFAILIQSPQVSQTLKTIFMMCWA